ncbi:MAG: flagellar motor switch protein FliN [Treponema sp.]|jgi:flagellar motor switch protein FliN/FliY|nr:flagellar motor switch protein FliN [Treponema sp.]
MSDGALSQDEIDALLAGVDSSSMPSAGSAPAAAAPGGGSENERRAFQDFLSGNIGAESSNLSMMTGATVDLKEPQVTFTNREALLGQLSDMVTVVKADYSSGFPGEHIFVMPEDTARSIASLMNKEENIQMDEMAMSVIGEVVSQLVGTQITDLTKKTNNKSIAAIAPEAANIKKAAAALPAGDFLSASYQLDLGDGKQHQMWEIYGGSVATDIARALNGGGSAPAMQGMPAMGGMDMAAMGMGGMNMQGMNMPGMAMGMGGMGMHGMPPMGAPTNVSAVQFPNLMHHPTPHEAGNISLIMDVFMEMTVELGRTRKLIKEILSMGEGTIIELDKLAGEPVDILVNHKLIAKGEVVVIDENFGVRVTEIVSPLERMNEMN